jgi:hypothetical protein
MRFRREVAFETVRIPTLLFAHLAIEFEFLEALGLDPLAQILERTLLRLGHVGNDSEKTCNDGSGEVMLVRMGLPPLR